MYFSNPYMEKTNFIDKVLSKINKISIDIGIILKYNYL
jgi:hypothetical protein